MDFYVLMKPGSPEYIKIHSQVRDKFGTPPCCFHCMSIWVAGFRFEWAHVKDTPWDLEETSWIRLCKRCHSKYDAKKRWRGGKNRQPELWAKRYASNTPFISKMIGYVPTKQTREKLSKAGKGRPAPNKGTTDSIETKIRKSESQLNRRKREQEQGIKRVQERIVCEKCSRDFPVNWIERHRRSCDA